jgi:CheY-like chemotaxis protein
VLEVLLVDDIAVNRRVAQLLLERAGHRVTEARDGHEAIARWAPGRFDLILMDAHMPGMDGLEATRLIREREAITGGHTPILALTGSAVHSRAWTGS